MKTLFCLKATFCVTFAVFMTTANARLYRCPSVAGKSYIPLIEADSSEEALSMALSKWDLVAIPKPTSCLPADESDRLNKEAERTYREDFLRRNAPRDDCPQIPPTPFAQNSVAEFAPTTARILLPREDCTTVMTVRQQIFVVGVGTALLEKCGMSLVQAESPEREFLFVGSGVGVMGLSATNVKRSVEQNLSNALGSQLNTSSILVVSQTLVNGLPQSVCENGLAKRWLSGLHQYLIRTRSIEPGRAFVETCVNTYRGSWPSEKCTCVGEVMRLSIPDIHEKAYSPALVSAGTNPIVMARLASCGAINLTPPQPAPGERQGALKRSQILRSCIDDSMRYPFGEIRDAAIKNCVESKNKGQ